MNLATHTSRAQREFARGWPMRIEYETRGLGSSLGPQPSPCSLLTGVPKRGVLLGSYADWPDEPGLLAPWDSSVHQGQPPHLAVQDKHALERKGKGGHFRLKTLRFAAGERGSHHCLYTLVTITCSAPSSVNRARNLSSGRFVPLNVDDGQRFVHRTSSHVLFFPPPRRRRLEELDAGGAVG
jgi:hypothetical protein